MIRNLSLFLVALVVALVLASWLGALWHEAAVSSRHFSLYWGWFSFQPLLAWLFQIVFFFAVGFLVVRGFRTPFLLWWAVSIGAAYSILQIVLGSVWISPSAGVFTYIGVYGGYLLSPTLIKPHAAA
jgi:hypothetical protein